VRFLKYIAAIVLALVFTGISAASAYLFGTHIASGAKGELFSVLGAAAEIVKALLPLAIAAAWTARQRTRVLVGCLMFLACMGWSLLSSIGNYSLARSENVTSTTTVQASYGDLKDQRDRAQRRIDAIGTQRTSSQIESEITAAKRDKLFDRSKACTEATAPESRVLCSAIDKLTGELAAAKEAESLQQQVSALSARMSGLDMNAVLRTADPQAAALARITGLNEDQVRDTIALFCAVLLELLSGFTLLVLMPIRRSNERTETQEQPQTTITDRIAVKATTKRPKSARIESIQFKPTSPVAHDLPILTSVAPVEPKALAVAPEAPTSTAEPIRVIGRVEHYASQRLTPMAGKRLRDDDLYGDYSRWCTGEGCQPLSQQEFAATFKTLSQIVGIVPVRGGYAGVGLVGLAA
jgi:hypothetical protein